MKKSRLVALILGCTILALFVFMSVCPKVFTPYAPKQTFELWLKPSASHILGTNDVGYDIFTEIVYGASQTFFIGISSSLLALILGALIGVLSAQNGFIGQIFSGLINLFVMLPKLVCLIVLAAFAGNGYLNRILLIALFGWVGTAREIRAKTIKIKSSSYIENCKIHGFGKIHIAVFHILPNLFDLLFARFLNGVNGSVMTESALSFLGIGDLYNPTWGTMINLAFRRGAFIRGAYNYLLMPAVCISLLVLAFYLIGLALKKEN